ncbi:MAG TPA: hypothetical protein VK846_00730 [Candidatus Limnocylindria bacterium]|nr:hypothetical protein [Candidatus Limnocylindria bacterium]
MSTNTKGRRKSVSDAIGVAELFVQACGGKMKSMFDGVSLVLASQPCMA